MEEKKSEKVIKQSDSIAGEYRGREPRRDDKEEDDKEE